MEDPSNGADKTTRLMITSMVLENFKSYAGEQEIGPFHKRFSSIVGPNGSGKSNVIDALLFVFGKRAKQLRLNKVSELIHRSSRFPDLEYAKVAVYFQLIIDDESSQDDYEVIPGSEFVVSRIAFQSNQSKYSVDGKNSTYTEVGALLRKYHIDLDNNRFLILQGEVEQIAMMKPKGQTPHEDGLLEYLEDIIGSNRYVEQIAAASTAVDGLNETRLERVKRLQIAQSDKDNLEGPCKEAHEYLEKEASLRHKKNTLYQYHWQECSRNVEQLGSKLGGYQAKLKYEHDKLKETEAQLKEIEKQYAMSNAEYERLNAEMQKTADDFTAYERRDTKMVEDMKYLKTQITKLNTSIKKESQKEADYAQEADKIHTEIETLKIEISAIEARKEVAEAHLDEVTSSLQESTATLRVELEEVQTHLTEADRVVSELLTEKEGIETSLDLVQSRAHAASKALQTAETRLAGLKSEERDLDQLRRDTEERQRVLINRSAALSARLDQLKSKQLKLQTSVRSAVADSEEARATHQAQQTTKNAASRAEVQSILKQARPGGVLANVAVRGRLGDLGTIPSEYDTAISTACGVLDFIVVDRAIDADACMSYLRETNIGRASFIVLEKLGLPAAKMNSCPRVPDGTSRLFDLVKPKDEVYRPAFYMGLKDTLVTHDWDLATRVAYEGDRVKWRIVTTTGNLIDTSGSMTGGGKVARSGGMSSQSAQVPSEAIITQEHIDRLDVTVSQLQGELSKCRADIAATEKELKETEQEVKKAAVQTEKNSVQKLRVLGEYHDLAGRVASFRTSCELTEDEKQSMGQMGAQLTDVIHRMEELCPDRIALQDRVHSLRQQILDVGGPKLKRAHSKVDSVNSEYDACRSRLCAAEVSLTSTAKQATKAGNAREKADAELVKSQEKWEALVEEQREMESEAEKVLLAQEAAKAAAQLKEEELTDIRAEFKRLDEVKMTVQGVKVDLANNVEKCSKTLKEEEDKSKHWSKELEKIRNQHSEDMREYRSFVETSDCASVSGSRNGEEQRKRESPAEIVSSDETVQRSPVMVPLKDLSEHELDAVLTMVSTNQSSGRVAKERGKQVQTAQDDDNEEGVDNDMPFGRGEEHSVRRESVEILKREINLMETDRDRLKGSVNITALAEYCKKAGEFRERLSELEKITAERNAARKEYEDLRRKRLEEFMSGFGTITLKLKEMYQMITLGGDAELELVDSLDPFSEGIVFSVRPPKKSWKNISNLSGGEKTLSSLALVFALHHFKPTPLYVMDEIDAALDFKNVSIVANYIKDRTKNAQFIIISLRNNMFELANRLVGIYKTHDSTKSVTINPRAFEGSLQPVTAPKVEYGPRKKSARTVSSMPAAGKLAACEEPSTLQGDSSKTVLGNSTNLRS